MQFLVIHHFLSLKLLIFQYVLLKLHPYGKLISKIQIFITSLYNEKYSDWGKP